MANEFVEQWMNKIRQGREYRKKYADDQKWEDYMKMYRGDWPEGILPVNKMFNYIRSMVPRVYFNAPRICVTPLKPELVWHAKVVEAIDNMLIQECFLKDTMKMSILDAFLCGTGPIKLGFDSEFGFNPDDVVMPEGETATQLSTKTGDKIEYKSYIKPGTPWALRAHPLTVIVPWGAQDQRSLEWICHYIVRPVEDVKQDSKFNAAARRRIKGTRSPSYITGVHSERDRTYGDKEVVYAELYEIRDFKKGKVYVICDDELLLDVEDTLQVEELPYEFIIFNRDPEFFWGIPDARIIEPRQQELNEVKTQIQRHRQIQLLKFLALPNAISQTEVQKFLSGDVGPFIFLEQNVENVQTAIMQFKPEIPVELYNEVQAILQDMKEELGFGTNQGAQLKGTTPPTATESAIVDQAFNIRLDERKDVVADVLVNIVRKWNQFIFKFWTEERVMRITTPEGPNAWIQYTGDELTGDYFLHLDPDTGVPMTRMLKYQLAKEMFMTFNGDQMIEQMMLRKMLLNHYAQVDPLADELVRVPDAMRQGMESPEMIAQRRQPQPMQQGRGSSQGHGQMKQGQPIPLDEFRQKQGQ